MGIFDRLGGALDKLTSPLTEEEAYQIVAKELAENKIDPGIRTRALTECEFDETRARAMYVKFRIAALYRDTAEEASRRRRWFKDAEESAHRNLKNGKYDLASIGFVELVKNKNDPVAMHNLGWLCEHGHVDGSSMDAALKWYRKAVDCGRDESSLALSELNYKQGQYKLAYEWAQYAVQKDVSGGKTARVKAAGAAGIKLSWWDK